MKIKLLLITLKNSMNNEDKTISASRARTKSGARQGDNLIKYGTNSAKNTISNHWITNLRHSNRLI